jgi:hypothetical protein
MRSLLLSTLLATLLALPTSAQEGAPRVDVGGFGSVRYELSEELRGSLTLLRLAGTIDARWRDRVRALSEVGYERLSGAGRLELTQAWGELRLGPVAARAGAVLPPVGRFNLHHGDHLRGIPRRPLIDRSALVLPVPATWTEVGIGLLGEHAIGERARLSWQAYVLDGAILDVTLGRRTVPSGDPIGLVVEAEVGATRDALDDSGALDALTGRVALSPTAASEIALSGYTGRYTPDVLDAAARSSTLGLDGQTRLGPLVAEGELLTTWYADVDRVVTELARAAYDQATASYTEGAEPQTAVDISFAGIANRRSGLWVDLSWPIPLSSGTLGFESPVLAPVARYEHVWLDRDVTEVRFADGRITQIAQPDREQARLALGLAFRPLPQAVVQAVYEANRARVGAMIDPAVADRITSGLAVALAVGF